MRFANPVSIMNSLCTKSFIAFFEATEAVVIHNRMSFYLSRKIACFSKKVMKVV